jgi:hypothetical protein
LLHKDAAGLSEEKYNKREKRVTVNQILDIFLEEIGVTKPRDKFNVSVVFHAFFSQFCIVEVRKIYEDLSTPSVFLFRSPRDDPGIAPSAELSLFFLLTALYCPNIWVQDPPRKIAWTGVERASAIVTERTSTLLSIHDRIVEIKNSPDPPANVHDKALEDLDKDEGAWEEKETLLFFAALLTPEFDNPAYLLTLL